MKANDVPTGDPQVSALLRQARVAPELPPGFQAHVWRRIEAAEATKAASWLDALANFVLRPRFAVAATLLMLLAGTFAGARNGWETARHEAQLNYLAAVAPQIER